MSYIFMNYIYSIYPKKREKKNLWNKKSSGAYENLLWCHKNYFISFYYAFKNNFYQYVKMIHFFGGRIQFFSVIVCVLYKKNHINDTKLIAKNSIIKIMQKLYVIIKT